MRVINFSEARNALKQVIDQVVSDVDTATIARRDPFMDPVVTQEARDLLFRRR